MNWQPIYFGGFFRPDHDPPVGGVLVKSSGAFSATFLGNSNCGSPFTN
jgi:hypothetical protein